MKKVIASLALIAVSAAPARAQVDGSVSLLVDFLPDVSSVAGRQQITEVRTRLFVERRHDLGAHFRVNLAGYVDGLLADREAGTARDAIIRPSDLYAEFHTTRVDVRAGASRLVWGRLDEFQPTDVVNPIDLSRFLLEGRSEARLAVPLVRGRVFLPQSSTIEAVLVPAFRPSRFDQLDEVTSPFNLAAPVGTIERREPAVAAENMQGGARFTTTTRRVDWGLSAYRGFRSLSTFTLERGRVVESFPRFTMLGGDFETVRGAWGLRGEAAATRGRPHDSIEAGVGVDRRAGEYRVAANILWSAADRSNLTLIGAADRSFARDTRTARVLAVYDPTDDTAFVRGTGAISLRDNVWMEGSAGIFAGSSQGTIGRLTGRDFLYLRLEYFF